MDLRTLIKEHKIIAILRKLPLPKTIEYIGALKNGGIKLIEVALNSDDACDQIRLIKQRFGDEVIIGAGTAVTVELAKNAVEAGARFLLTPSVHIDVLEFCSENGIEILPGVMTPTDVATCLRYNYHTLKLFPSSDLPPTYIKSLKGPFADTDYVAVGGVSINNINNFFKNGFIGVGVGSSLVPLNYIKNNEWAKASESVARLIDSIKGAGAYENQ